MWSLGGTTRGDDGGRKREWGVSVNIANEEVFTRGVSVTSGDEGKAPALSAVAMTSDYKMVPWSKTVRGFITFYYIWNTGPG
jgi:hypothetical protein